MKINVSNEILMNKDKLFKPTAYDIRAYVGKPGSFFNDDAVLTPYAMEITGAIMGSMVYKTEVGDIGLNVGDAVVVGYDNGPTSKELAQAFAKGLISQGVNIYDIGVSSSGQVYYNQSQLGAQGHVQITRSHVEVTTNGAKFGIGLQGIHTYLLKQMRDELSNGVIGRSGEDKGTLFDKSDEGQKLYFQLMVDRYKGYFSRNPRKICVNLFGGTGLKYKSLFKDILGEQTIILGDNLDVNSGELLADPTRKEMLQKVEYFQKILDEGFRIHSFDLDADRGSITEGSKALGIGTTGHYLGDELSYILADYKLSHAVPRLMIALENRDIPAENLDLIHSITTTVLVDARYTSGVSSYVLHNGGTTLYHCKGHSLWKETIQNNMERAARLAGFKNAADFAASTGYQDKQIEASLHLFVTDPLNAIARDDAIENVFILEKIMDELGIKSLNDYFSKIPRRFITKEIRTNAVSNEVKEKITHYVINELREAFKSEQYKIVEFDGQIRIDWATGFIMYGMSNTSPKLTFMAEGSTQDERNLALAYILALHNAAKQQYGDSSGMDLNENAFFTEDLTYNMENPDDITGLDQRVIKFKKVMGL